MPKFCYYKHYVCMAIQLSSVDLMKATTQLTHPQVVGLILPLLLLPPVYATKDGTIMYTDTNQYKLKLILVHIRI